MKLHISVNSPYVRVVRVLLREIGGVPVEEVVSDPRDPDGGFWSVNPVGRIPALELPDGTGIAESMLICRHIDQKFADGRFHAGVDRDAGRLAIHGLAIGTLDRGVAARIEKLRTPGPDSEAYIDGLLAAVTRGADAMDRAFRFQEQSASPDIVDMAVACTVEWLQFRHPETTPLDGRPALAAAVAAVADRQSMIDTRPG